jgi:coenzyme F420-reducing hydrogenase delta subunit
MLRPFERGLDGVLVLTCGRDNCKSLEGSRRAAMRVRETNNILDEVGLGSSRVLIQQADGNAEDLFMQALDELLAETKALGTNPVRGTS